ncbi:hypothetical protein B0H65DRAFT_472651 [Neurospora tetraspora]|uniref:Secreted protein n=1 Tax=Neurospora tetraspora TaxID=94610 RepID=A0AAE0JAW5_9PEZI|nr:hypothetical protein B0H65DRAFT_472651 [Neurospora tetraspora]
MPVAKTGHFLTKLFQLIIANTWATVWRWTGCGRCQAGGLQTGDSGQWIVEVDSNRAPWTWDRGSLSLLLSLRYNRRPRPKWTRDGTGIDLASFRAKYVVVCCGLSLFSEGDVYMR